MIPVLAWPAAALVGLSLGLLGSGGSILTVPLLHSIVGLPLAEAVATSYAVVGSVAFAGCLGHAQGGTVRLRDSGLFVAASVPSAFLAKRFVDPLLPTPVRTWAFAALMLVAAWRMAFGSHYPHAHGAPHGRPLVVLAAVVVGALTGLLGVGGGFVIVPALVLLLRFSMRDAVGTSLAVIALNCGASLVANALGPRTPIDWGLAALFTAVGVGGVFLGAKVAGRLSHVTLRRVFAAVVVAMAVLLLLDPFGAR